MFIILFPLFSLPFPIMCGATPNPGLFSHLNRCLQVMATDHPSRCTVDPEASGPSV